MEDSTLYNQITVRNIDSEDFLFKVNREQYMIPANTTRSFPKFMVRPLLKHLIDKILIKRDPEGKLLRNQNLRDELASRIVLNEEQFDKPRIPTDREIVDQMTSKEPELDRILAKNKERAKEEQTNLIPPPDVNTSTVKVDMKKVDVKVQSIKSKQPVVNTTKPVSDVDSDDEFDQIKDEKEKKSQAEIPSRESMLKYAKDKLMMELDDPKTKKSIDSLTDQQLFVELGLDKEEDLSELGF